LFEKNSEKEKLYRKYKVEKVKIKYGNQSDKIISIFDLISILLLIFSFIPGSLKNKERKGKVLTNNPIPKTKNIVPGITGRKMPTIPTIVKTIPKINWIILLIFLKIKVPIKQKLAIKTEFSKEILQKQILKKCSL